MRDFENKQPFDYAAAAHKRTSTPYSAYFSHILLENAITNVRNRTFKLRCVKKALIPHAVNLHHLQGASGT